MFNFKTYNTYRHTVTLFSEANQGGSTSFTKRGIKFIKIVNYSNYDEDTIHRTMFCTTNKDILYF